MKGGSGPTKMKQNYVKNSLVILKTNLNRKGKKKEGKTKRKKSL